MESGNFFSIFGLAMTSGLFLFRIVLVGCFLEASTPGDSDNYERYDCKWYL